MNIMERDQGEARLHYLDGEYEIVTPGSYVVCFDGRQSFVGSGFVPQCYNGITWTG